MLVKGMRPGAVWTQTIQGGDSQRSGKRAVASTPGFALRQFYAELRCQRARPTDDETGACPETGDQPPTGKDETNMTYDLRGVPVSS